MIRLELVRREILERFERVDRRFAQNEQRTGRIDQRLGEIADQIDALREEILAQLELLARVSAADYLNGREPEPASRAAAEPPATPT